MILFLHILAWFSIVLVMFSAVTYPMLLGMPRNPYNYSGFISAVLEAVFVTILCLRVLGYI